ncbi:hypothetical protein ABTM55_19610, partial [Acinetobacter baumannii]
DSDGGGARPPTLPEDVLPRARRAGRDSAGGATVSCHWHRPPVSIRTECALCKGACGRICEACLRNRFNEDTLVTVSSDL